MDYQYFFQSLYHGFTVLECWELRKNVLKNLVWHLINKSVFINVENLVEHFIKPEQCQKKIRW